MKIIKIEIISVLNFLNLKLFKFGARVSQSFGAKFKFNSINRFKGSVSHVLIVVLDPGDRKNIRQRKQLPLLPLPAVCLCSERTQHTHVQAGPLCVCAGKSTTKEKQENYERNTKKEK